MKKQICFIGITVVLLFSGCGFHVEDGDKTIVLQTPVIETAVGTEEEVYLEENLLPLPDELKSMDGSEEWQKGMEEYCKKAAPFWKEIVDRAPLKWGEEIPELEPYEMLSAFFTMWGYVNQKGMGTLLYSENAFQILGGAGTGLAVDSTYLPYLSITEIEKGKTEGYHTKFHGIFANGGDGEIQYTLRDEEETIVWEHTQGPGCDQIFFDMELKDGAYSMYAEVKSGNPFPNGAICEYYRFTDEENENAMKEYAQFHGEEN